MPEDATATVRFLLACPECRRQFEAGSLPPGSLFHCSCGATIRVPKLKARDAAVVRCSACSATREAGADRCSHCGSDFTLHERDLHTICPSCMTRISDRARYCHGCATPILPHGRAGEPSDHPCPACDGKKRTLCSRRLGRAGITVLECRVCAGMWLGRDAFRLVSDRARSSAVPEDLFAAPAPPAAAPAPRGATRGALYRKCPECLRMMNRRNFGRRSGVIVDTCREHGVWFDLGELERILAWIREGGEDREGRRAALEVRAPSRVDRTIADRIERMAGLGGGSAGLRRRSSGTDLLGDVLRALFDV